MSEEKQPRKNNSVRHTRAIQKNRISHPVAAPSDTQVRERIQEIIHPATLAQIGHFHRLGLRERTLEFVVMIAFVLKMLWHQIRSINALTRLVQKEAMLWEKPKKVTQQTLSQRSTSLPADYFKFVDKSYLKFSIFVKLSVKNVKFITRAKTNLTYTLERSIVKAAAVHNSVF